MTIESYVCSACGASRFRDDEEGNFICEYCGTVYELARHKYQCRVCSTVNPAEARRCMKCGSALGRQCPICTHLNSPGATECEECGTTLDALTSITTRTPQAGELNRRTERLVASKWGDAAYMQQERARLDAEERARLARIAEQRAINQQQQKQLVLYVGIGVAAFIVVIIVLAVLLSAV